MWAIALRITFGSSLWSIYFLTCRVFHLVPCGAGVWMTPAATFALVGYTAVVAVRWTRHATLERLTNDLTQGHPDNPESFGAAWDRPQVS